VSRILLAVFCALIDESNAVG